MINKFDGKYRFLSNFYPAPTRIGMYIYPTVENAYQACKCDDPDDFEQFLTLTPGQAKRAGRRVRLSPEFESRKLDLMYSLVRSKFVNEELAQMLLDTGEEELVEGNTWHDCFWGSCNCILCNGKEKHNHLGRILMRVREELRNG
jgi:hypothetical protein